MYTTLYLQKYPHLTTDREKNVQLVSNNITIQTEAISVQNVINPYCIYEWQTFSLWHG